MHKQEPAGNLTLTLTILRNIVPSRGDLSLPMYFSGQAMLWDFFLKVLPKFHFHILLLKFKFLCPSSFAVSHLVHLICSA